MTSMSLMFSITEISSEEIICSIHYEDAFFESTITIDSLKIITIKKLKNILLFNTNTTNYNITKNIILGEKKQLHIIIKYSDEEISYEEIIILNEINVPTELILQKEIAQLKNTVIELTNKISELSSSSVTKTTLEQDLEEAILYDSTNIQHIPKDKLTRKMCMIAFEQNVINIQYIPIYFITREMCENAFEINKTIVLHIPDKYKTIKMWNYISENHRSYLKNVPDKYYNIFFRHILDSDKTQIMCNSAFEINKTLIEFIPPKYQTQKMCNEAFEHDKVVKIYSNTFLDTQNVEFGI